MIRIGAVNIDTSHPLAFAEYLAGSDRARYVAVYNDSFRDDAEVDGFISRFGLEKRCESLEELADMVDVAFIQGCDWDDHLRCAQPFWDKGKAVFIDKPVVGSVRDCKKLAELVEQGAVLLGSSSARYAFELQAYNAIPLDERGKIINVTGSCGVDEFNYGIHIVEAIGGLLGEGAVSVQYIGRSEAEGPYCESYSIRFRSGQTAIYSIMTGVWQPFAITVMTDKKTWSQVLDAGRLYAALLEEVLNKIEGKPSLLVEPRALIESVKIMLAGKHSRETGTVVRVDELPEDLSFDGAAFAQSYGSTAGKLYS